MVAVDLSGWDTWHRGWAADRHRDVPVHGSRRIDAPLARTSGRDAGCAADGLIVKTSGDGFHAVFRDPGRASSSGKRCVINESGVSGRAASISAASSISRRPACPQ